MSFFNTSHTIPPNLHAINMISALLTLKYSVLVPLPWIQEDSRLWRKRHCVFPKMVHNRFTASALFSWDAAPGPHYQPPRKPNDPEAGSRCCSCGPAKVSANSEHQLADTLSERFWMVSDHITLTPSLLAFPAETPEIRYGYSAKFLIYSICE